VWWYNTFAQVFQLLSIPFFRPNFKVQRVGEGSTFPFLSNKEEAKSQKRENECDSSVPYQRWFSIQFGKEFAKVERFDFVGDMEEEWIYPLCISTSSEDFTRTKVAEGLSKVFPFDFKI
jgi:hypothetical protein